LHLIQAEKLRTVGRLAAGVAHEVKNPLAIIRLGTGLLTKKIDTQDTSIKRTLSDMNSAVERADAIITGVLDFSSQRPQELKAEKLEKIMSAALLLVKHELDKSGVDVVQERADRLPEVNVDRTRIEQVFVILFSNAIRAMTGGGQLILRTKAYVKKLSETGGRVGRRLDDGFAVGETAVVVEVDDSGSGIAGEHLDKVFDPFFTTREAGKGAGLGLSIARSIMEAHGGCIDVSNREEGGVRVTLMFKVAEEDSFQ